ncbi:MAG: glycoside hydrolase family 5 protein [Clostridia bacterium]|nr:glycoside hydrolase family 5 protein [Clostridia bacterium]
MKILKRIIAILVALMIIIAGAVFVLKDEILYPDYEITDSIRFAQELGCGWNLGNTFDACDKGSTEKMGLESETMWGNPETTKELLAFVKECGFDTIRVPVTWAQHMGGAPDYTIDEAWLDRVNLIVDWCYELDLKVIINTHHDDAFWLITDNAHKESSKEILTKLWIQISERFAAYDENLVFETMNEPRVFGAEDEWYGNEETREVVNYLNFSALEAIRSTGGNNAERYVLIPTYAASGLDENIDALALPEDERVIVSVHYYFGTAHQSEFSDCEKEWSLGEKYSLYKTFRRLHDRFISKGYGVVKSEFGWTDRDNMENLVANTTYYVETAEKLGFPCMVWDNGSHFGLIDRNNLSEIYPEYINAVTKQEK